MVSGGEKPQIGGYLCVWPGQTAVESTVRDAQAAASIIHRIWYSTVHGIECAFETRRPQREIPVGALIGFASLLDQCYHLLLRNHGIAQRPL
jgi:hypothetical protein